MKPASPCHEVAVESLLDAVSQNMLLDARNVYRREEEGKALGHHERHPTLSRPNRGLEPGDSKAC